jgi:CheY-like chemotaxis protein
VQVPVKISILPSSHELVHVNTQLLPPTLKKEFAHGKPDVLIVENDEINTAHLVHIFKDICNVKTAGNGTEALRLAQLTRFKVILMDINLGAGMNGMQTAQAIRKFEGYLHTPIIAVTANAMKGHREEFLANGCSHYISKPFSSDSIKQMVFDLIEDGRS